MTKLFISFALAALALNTAPQALKAAPLCPLGNATLHGTYVVSGGGTIVNVGPVTSVGEVTYDGQGNSNATFTVSVNGNVQTVNVPGTYTVSPDCTATAVEGPSHYNFVITPNGNTVWWMATDPGFVLSGTIIRLRPLESSEDASRRRSTNQRAVPANLHSAPAANALPNPKIQQTAQRLPAVSKAS
jgi:hypothetical protein